MNKVIAISGPPGSGSTTTAKLLAQKLNLNYFSLGQVFKDISRGKVKEAFYYPTFKQLCNQKNLVIPEFEESDDSSGALNLWQTEFGKSPTLHKTIDDLQIELANQGNIIIDAKLSLHMNKDANKKVWLFANLEERSKRSAKRDGLDHQKAIEIVRKRQDTERKEWSSIYGIDYFDQENLANLKIDTTFKSPEEVVNFIISNLN